MVLIKDPIQKRILVSYLVDWALVVIMTAVFFAIDKIPPYHRAFSVQDKTIMFPYTENEAVPIWSLGVSCPFYFHVFCLLDSTVLGWLII
jgi:diacylglycerol diphosphate phosphatase/phosphatidate phosphatase